VAPDQRHGVDYLRLGYGDHFDAVPRQYREVSRADQCPQAIGDRVGIVGGNTLAVGQRSGRVVGTGGFGAGNAHMRCHLRGGQGDSRKQSAAADRSNDVIQVRGLGQEFERRRPLTGDDVIVIVRRNRGLAVVDQRLQPGLARGLVRRAEVDGAAVGPYGFHFACHRDFGHHYVGRKPAGGSRGGKCGAMITG